MGRAYTEPADITARICGICPVAYQMSACLAIEDACGVRVEGPLHDLRRLLYCGEWIESHTLHVHLLHAPDFLGYEGAIDLARDHRTEVERGLELKKIGNEIVEVVGGRAIHPVNVKVGGFYRLPSRQERRTHGSDCCGPPTWPPRWWPGWAASTSLISPTTTSWSRSRTPSATRSWTAGS